MTCKDILTMLIQTTTPNIARTLDFYDRLSFTRIGDNLLTDGQAVIRINTNHKARTGLVFFRDSWADFLEGLSYPHTKLKDSDTTVVSGPDGVRIFLETGEEPVITHQDVIMPSLAGAYAGISLESVDMQRANAFYESLGFTHDQGSPDKGWVSLLNEDRQGISIMGMDSCPHQFFQPGLTYFNSGKNPAHITRIREAGVPIHEEITVFNNKGEVDNIILLDPGGLGFFIFND